MFSDEPSDKSSSASVSGSAKEKANELSAADAGNSFWASEANDEELPLSSPINNELQVMQVNKSMSPDQLLHQKTIRKLWLIKKQNWRVGWEGTEMVMLVPEKIRILLNI